jgi:hypothetical protein
MLGVIALIAVIVAAYFAYKTANDNGRSGPLWALATIGIGFGLQIVVPILIGIILGVIYVMMGTPVDQLQEQISGPATIIGFISIFLSFVGIWLVLRHVAKLPEDPPVERVPPPPTFDQNQ